jgi:hypothetical protein
MTFVSRPVFPEDEKKRNLENVFWILTDVKNLDQRSGLLLSFRLKGTFSRKA